MNSVTIIPGSGLRILRCPQAHSEAESSIVFFLKKGAMSVVLIIQLIETSASAIHVRTVRRALMALIDTDAGATWAFMEPIVRLVSIVLSSEICFIMPGNTRDVRLIEVQVLGMTAALSEKQEKSYIPDVMNGCDAIKSEIACITLQLAVYYCLETMLTFDCF